METHIVMYLFKSLDLFSSVLSVLTASLSVKRDPSLNAQNIFQKCVFFQKQQPNAQSGYVNELESYKNSMPKPGNLSSKEFARFTTNLGHQLRHEFYGNYKNGCFYFGFERRVFSCCGNIFYGMGLTGFVYQENVILIEMFFSG